mmetsp:Transcript_5285/g.23420  ORF Transcript_5285/g.23420 Transcript_5285/m.23420 type:complete len:213 (-) Transcript_5285:643-1281(-)
MTRIAISTSTASASVVGLHRLLFSNPSAPPPSRTPSPSPAAAYSLPLKNSIAVGPTVCASPMAPAFAALRINRTSASSPPGGALRIHTSASRLYPCGATPSANAACQYRAKYPAFIATSSLRASDNDAASASLCDDFAIRSASTALCVWRFTAASISSFCAANLATVASRCRAVPSTRIRSATSRRERASASSSAVRASRSRASAPRRRSRR